MHSRFSSSRCFGAIVLAASTALTLGGCTQATRHANLMVFGTNTAFGVVAGKDVDTPAVTVGYKRQELVLMPLVANEAENGRGQLTPCRMSADPRPDHPCLLVATRGEGEHHTAKDSYSVLASFGASFDGGSGASASVKGGLAQYFATGVAAQLLALSGGAALVATGQAAASSAQNKPDAAAVAAVTGDPALALALADKTVQQTAKDHALTNQNAAALAVQYLTGVPDGEFLTEIGALDAAAGLGTNLVAACPTKERCFAQIPIVFAGRDPALIAQAVLQRAQARGASK